jgi:translation initiation factor eIF-2B subunit epsilon
MAKGGGKTAVGKSGKKGDKHGGGTNEDVKRDNPLQAIVFADSFTETFRPISLEAPKVLLPLANVPMLEYSLEFLASSGVKEVILFCTYHADRIEDYVKNHSQVAKRVNVQCIHAPTCITAGDALREIDRQQLVQSNPFILMSGDVVANVNLKDAIKEHQERKKKEPSCMMTSIFKEIPSNFTTNIRPLNDELIVGIDPTSSQIVLYESDPYKRSTHIATVFLEEHSQIAIRSDLMDCYIDVCSPEVLLKFAEDFDYQDLRQDFLHNEVQNYELGKKFFVKVVTDEFAARVMDPRTYAGISRAILQRWVFPLVPDNNYLGPVDSSYLYHRGMIYKEEGISLSRTCVIQRETIIGCGSKFGNNTRITKSTIGRNCTVGSNVTITGSFLWKNIVIEDDVTIHNAILCDNVVIRKGAVIEEGCVLSFGVGIGAGFTLKAFSKVTTALPVEQDDGFSSDEDEDNKKKAEDKKIAAENGEWDPKEVGEGGVGRLWTLDDDAIEVEGESDDEEDDNSVNEDIKRLNKLKSLMIGADDIVQKRSHKWEDWETLSSSDEEDDNLDEFAAPVEVPFNRIIRDMVYGGEQAGHGIDDLFLEIKSFKFAQNKSFADIIGAILPGLFDMITTDDKSAMTILGEVRTKFNRWSSVIKRCLVDTEDQMAVITSIESYCSHEAHRDAWSPLFRFLLQTVYDLEWVMEEIILEWHTRRLASPPEINLAQNPEVIEFIAWLQEEEDESDDEEEDDD